jgi:pimeloyl-ACP methyl ester carboxylesterase
VLGFDQVNLYGISYGSRLGLEMLRRHGEHVRAAFLEGLVPAQISWAQASPASHYGALSALNASCAAAGACGTTFGDLRTAFLAGVDALDASPLTLSLPTGPTELDGYTYAALTIELLYARSSYPWLPLMITDLAARRTDRVASFLYSAVEAMTEGTATISHGVYYAIVCGELMNPPDPNATTTLNAGVPQAYVDLFDTTFHLISLCTPWPKHDLASMLAQPVTSSVPAFISSGRMDPITPPGFGDIVAASLDHSTVVVYEASGHGATRQSTCAQANRDAFLADPTAPVDTSCAASLTVDYVLPDMLRTVTPPPASRIRAELSFAPPVLLNAPH